MERYAKKISIKTYSFIKPTEQFSQALWSFVPAVIGPNDSLEHADLV
jgi:hypothetical protein